MLDLSKEIKPDKENYKLYKKLRVLLYLTAFILAFYLAFLIIFPNLLFTFSFLNPNSSKNTVFNPRLPNNNFPKKGSVQETALFNTNFFGSYSSAKVNFKLNKKSPLPNPLSVSVKKSFQSFLYEDGGSLGFKNGSLLKNNENFFIISKEKLRKFSNSYLLSSLGYSQEDFQEVPIEDLQYNLPGENIEKNNEYPDSAIFIVDDNYYVLENQTLKKFVSDQAFLSGYNLDQAIKKDIDFLNKFPLSEDLAGFADGTIIAYDISAYIIDSNQILPINNTQTFENKGFNWEDVTKVGSDEIANYEKGKLFTINSPHSDGVVFKSIEDSNYYIVKDGKKYLLPTESIARSWLRKDPVKASRESLKTEESCELKQSAFNSKSYSCEIPLDAFDSLLGTSYEFKLKTNQDIRLETINVRFKKDINMKNLKIFFSDLLGRIKQNYVPA